MRITIFVYLAVCLPVSLAQEEEEAVELPLPVARQGDPNLPSGLQPAQSGSESEDEATTLKDSYTFVALIDIVFTDGCKRTCTGAIIHDNVVITAAHCFTMLRDNYMQPELTMSFVVIGTKIMFDTGYEQYLPIERVVTHQRFKGWTADLALVYTFAGMISDKPGQVLSIASASNAPVDSNVTVLSWGRCKGDMDYDEFRVTKSGSDSSRENKHRKKKHQHRASIRGGVPDTRHYKDDRSKDPYQSRFKLKNSDTIGQLAHRAVDGRLSDGRARKEGNTTRISRYLGANEGVPMKNAHHSETTTSVVASLSEETKYSNDKYLFQTLFDEEKKIRAKVSPKKFIDKRVLRPHHRIRRMMPKAKYMEDLSHYKSWRRQSGSQHNNLTVGSFGYVNLAACKKIVERTLPPLYEIHNKNEVLCYASEEFYITNEDSGAPVVQKDQLVAVTVGGVDSNGEHVAVGMKISCFCSWIAANLPNGAGDKMKCCTNCCNNTKKEKVSWLSPTDGKTTAHSWPWTILVAEQKKPVSSNEQKRPVLINEQKRPPSWNEEERPISSNEQNKPISSKEQKMPASSNEHKGPISSNKHKKPTSSSEHKGPISSNKHKRPTSSNEQKGPISSDKHKKPISSKEQKGPISSHKHERPTLSNEHNRPISSNKHKKPTSSTEHKGPISSNKHKKPISSNEKQGPISSNKHKKPTSSNEQQRPIYSDKHKKPISSNEQIGSIYLDKHKKPTSSNEHKGPISSNKHKKPISSNEQKGPISSNKHKKPIASDEQKGPISSNKHERPISSNEQKGPIYLDKHKKPISSSEQKGPVSSNKHKEPTSSKEQKGPNSSNKHERPTSSNEHKRPIYSDNHKKQISSNEQKGPISSNKHKKQISSDEQKGPISSNKHERPTSSNEQKKPIYSDKHKKPISSKEHDRPISGNEQKMPNLATVIDHSKHHTHTTSPPIVHFWPWTVLVGEEKNPVSSNEQKRPIPPSDHTKPIHSDKHKKPISSNEQKWLIPFDKHKKPISSKEHERPISSNEQKRSTPGSDIDKSKHHIHTPTVSSNYLWITIFDPVQQKLVTIDGWPISAEEQQTRPISDNDIEITTRPHPIPTTIFVNEETEKSEEKTESEKTAEEDSYYYK